MIETTKRNFLKGLFISASLPVLPKHQITTNVDIAKAEIYLLNSQVFRSITLEQVNNPLLTDILTYGSDYLNSTAFEIKDDYYRISLINYFVDKLQPIKDTRVLYDYAVLSDDRNNTPYDVENNPMKVVVSCLLDFLKLSSRYQFNLIYDPTTGV